MNNSNPAFLVTLLGISLFVNLVQKGMWQQKNNEVRYLISMIDRHGIELDGFDLLALQEIRNGSRSKKR